MTERLFKDIGVIAGNDDDFFDTAFSEMLNISLDEAHAADEFKRLDIVRCFCESAAESCGQNDGLFRRFGSSGIFFMT